MNSACAAAAPEFSKLTSPTSAGPDSAAETLVTTSSNAPAICPIPIPHGFSYVRSHPELWQAMSKLHPRPVLIVLPKRDFDPSEAAITWLILGGVDLSVTFATPDGQPAAADPLMLSGEGLDLWGK